MDEMEKNFKVFREVNYWWSRGCVPPEFMDCVERGLLKEIKEVIDQPQMVLIEGPRRVGKTSLFYQIIDYLIKEGVEPKRIFYLSLDDPLLVKERVFEDIVEFIGIYLAKRAVRDLSSRVYLLLDEVTHIDGWEFYLKRYYDQKYPFKFFVSSSSSTFLKKRSKESLAGRVISYQLFPFSFVEFLRLKTAFSKPIPFYESLSGLWEEAFEDWDQAAIYKELSQLRLEFSFFEEEVKQSLTSYLLEGGFPEFLSLKEGKVKDRYFWDNVAERVVYRDIPEIFGVEDRELLQKTLIYSIENAGQMLNTVNIANSFGTSRQTISLYLYYLCCGLLIGLLEKYAKTKAGRMKAYKKVYPVDTGLFVNLLKIPLERIETSGLWGRIVEILVHQLLRRYTKRDKVYYYREREKEVDFVIDTYLHPLPIEVKYRGEMKEMSGLFRFMDIFKAKKPLVITKDRLDLKDQILYVPLWMFVS